MTQRTAQRHHFTCEALDDPSVRRCFLVFRRGPGPYLPLSPRRFGGRASLPEVKLERRRSGARVISAGAHLKDVGVVVHKR